MIIPAMWNSDRAEVRRAGGPHPTTCQHERSHIVATSGDSWAAGAPVAHSVLIVRLADRLQESSVDALVVRPQNPPSASP